MKMGNVGRGSFDLTKVDFVAAGKLPENQHLLRRGDVILNTRNTPELVGKVAIWRDELPTAYYNSNLVRLEFAPEQIHDSFYAGYALNSASAISQLKDVATGTTSVAAIYARDLANVSLLIPPPGEQRAIAAALSDADALIAALDDLIAKKRAMKQGAMQQLLTGTRRLPGFGKPAAIKGALPTGWQQRAFLEVVSHHAGDSTLIKGRLSQEKLPHLYPAYSASGQDVWHHSFAEEGDALVISAVGSRCGRAYRAAGRWSAIANTHVVWPTDNVDLAYLQLLIDDEDFWQKSGTGQPFILFSKTFKTKFLEPPLPEQRAIAGVLSDMGAEIAALEKGRDKTRAIKQGMMQSLLTGRVRLVPNSKEATA